MALILHSGAIKGTVHTKINLTCRVTYPSRFSRCGLPSLGDISHKHVQNILELGPKTHIVIISGDIVITISADEYFTSEQPTFLGLDISAALQYLCIKQFCHILPLTKCSFLRFEHYIEP